MNYILWGQGTKEIVACPCVLSKGVNGFSPGFDLDHKPYVPAKLTNYFHLPLEMPKNVWHSAPAPPKTFL